MSGFDNGTMQGGVFSQTKQLGSVLRGSGPPVPQMGVIGDLYIDGLTWQLFNKRAPNSVDPWGHYLFVVPATYRATLKWFSGSAPSNDIGVNGDYCLLWGGFANYGMQPSIYGPKAAGVWPSSPAAVAVTLNTLYTAQDILDAAAADVVPIDITASTYTITSPGIYRVNYAGTVNITMVPSAVMSRGDITIKDVSGNAHTNVINIHADAGDTNKIDGLDPYVINTDFGAVTLYSATLGYDVI